MWVFIIASDVESNFLSRWRDDVTEKDYETYLSSKEESFLSFVGIVLNVQKKMINEFFN